MEISMTRILIADDHAVVREGLKQIISRAADMTVVGEAATGEEALRKALAQVCDVMVLDINMPDLSGLEVLKQIRRENLKLPILVLSMYSEDAYAVRTLRAGASGYLEKESSPDQLLAAIRKVSLGGKYVSPSLAERLASDMDADSERAPHQKLSDREFQVLRLLSSGKTVKEIAQELSVGAPSVCTYRARILSKMRMRHVAELTHYAIRNRLAD
jgi:DNA-binding NarL/FixJ family response regulator